MREGRRREVLIPAVDHVVRKVDLDARRVIIRPLEGMLD
jgi:ribosomal 30S subunit maturation factor RimM